MQSRERGCLQGTEVIMYDIWVDSAKGNHGVGSNSAQLLLPALQQGGFIR